MKPEEIAMHLTLKGIEQGSIRVREPGAKTADQAAAIAEAFDIILAGVRKSTFGAD